MTIVSHDGTTARSLSKSRQIVDYLENLRSKSRQRCGEQLKNIGCSGQKLLSFLGNSCQASTEENLRMVFKIQPFNRSR